MKTIKSFLFVSFFYCLMFQSVYGQNNFVLTGNNATPGVRNVLLGNNAGDNMTNPSPQIVNGENVFVGHDSGTNSNATIGAPSDSSRNTFVGHATGFSNTIGSDNVFLGYRTGYQNTTGVNNVIIQSARSFVPTSTLVGSNNTIVGYTAGQNLSSGGSNSFFGTGAGRDQLSGSYNLFLGYNAGANLLDGTNNIYIGKEVNLSTANNLGGSDNIYIGTQSATTNIGVKNTLIGFGSGQGLKTGTVNTFLGNVVVPSNFAATTTSAGNNTSYTIILADGGGNQKLYIHGNDADPNKNGNTGIGTGDNVIPRNRLEVKSAYLNSALLSSGLRLTNLKNTITPVNNPSPLADKGVLSVDLNGDVILVKDNGSNGITQNCSTANFVPLNNTTSNQLICSQIYDNSTILGIGTSVGIGYSNSTSATAAFGYTGLLPGTWTAPGTTPAPGSGVSGTFRLTVNGATKSTAFYSTSDKRFKKDIKPIENALAVVQAIDGKTYVWNKEANKDMNFDEGGHSGFLAQDLEKVLPHLVATGQNGDKAVNYIELLPYLVEAIKDQQTQIEELKAQLSENFKVQNQDLIGLENTKIISVSPNPSNDLISISLNIEQSVQNATLQVHDLNGKLLSNLVITDRANNITKTLQKDNFGKGMYIVSLIVNGKSVDAKKIIFN